MELLGGKKVIGHALPMAFGQGGEDAVQRVTGEVMKLFEQITHV